MIVTREELDRFHDFAIAQVSQGRGEMTWLELFDLWKLENPTLAEQLANTAAVRQALTAMDEGRMRPFSAFDAEFRQRHGLRDET